MAIHVGLLTGVYALGQFFFAPVWGRLSDRTGRRPLVLVGIGGYVIAQVLFGLATSLWLLYAARILGGILSAATLPVSAAYVADMTADEERGRGMAWLGTAVSLGFVVGPALGGTLSRRDLHFIARYGHFIYAKLACDVEPMDDPRSWRCRYRASGCARHGAGSGAWDYHYGNYCCGLRGLEARNSALARTAWSTVPALDRRNFSPGAVNA